MNFKLIYSNYDNTTGISTAIISTSLGEFMGTSKLHEEDKDIESTFAGCEYAETKAILKFMKAKIKQLNEKIKTLENFQKLLKNMASYNHNSIENRKLRHQIYIIKSQKEKWINNYNSLSKKLYEKMEKRELVVKKMQERKRLNNG